MQRSSTLGAPSSSSRKGCDRRLEVPRAARASLDLARGNRQDRSSSRAAALGRRARRALRRARLRSRSRRQSARSARRRGGRGVAARLRAHAGHDASGARVLAVLVGGARRERVRSTGAGATMRRCCRRSGSTGSGNHGSSSRSRCRPGWPAIRRPSTSRCTGPTAAASPIESKFAEWLMPRPRGQAAFKDKYFRARRGRLGGARSAACQAFAEDLQAGRERLKLLNAAQLLKHALGLANNGLRTSALVYLYYDWPGREAATHRSRDRPRRWRGSPRNRLARARRTKRCFAALRDAPGLRRDLLDYLAQRYFVVSPRGVRSRKASLSMAATRRPNHLQVALLHRLYVTAPAGTADLGGRGARGLRRRRRSRSSAAASRSPALSSRRIASVPVVACRESRTARNRQVPGARHPKRSTTACAPSIGASILASTGRWPSIARARVLQSRTRSSLR